jgi:hypothetical protein
LNYTQSQLTIGLLLLGNIMKIYLSGTANLGDFLNGLPVMSGISKAHGKYELIIKKVKF